MYSLLRQLMFLLPPEKAHHLSMDLLQQFSKLSPARKLLAGAFTFNDPSLRKKLFGLEFPNPVGLGAGFDKNAVYLDELATLGFGFVEIGTVTPLPQPGNDQPRLFRLPADKALVNRMGFNNNGMQAIRGRLEAWRNSGKNQQFIVGGNIGKNKVTSNEDAWKDYEACFTALQEVVDYFVVNVSSPNTPGLRELQDKDSLRKILLNLKERNAAGKARPLLLKIAPDLTDGQIEDIVSLAFEVELDGLVATNTTISRNGLVTPAPEVDNIGAGGLSGRPVKDMSANVLAMIMKGSGGKLPVISSGGIFTGEDAKERLDAGASLVQVWTGFIYEGPAIAKKICRYLVKHNRQHNY